MQASQVYRPQKAYRVQGLGPTAFNSSWVEGFTTKPSLSVHTTRLHEDSVGTGYGRAVVVQG